jgi:hypothetical protein
VNDFETIELIQEDTRNNIVEIIGRTDEAIYSKLDILFNIRLSNKQIEDLLNMFSEYTLPFELPTQKKLEKIFKKVKKVRMPEIDDKFLKFSTFVGWNDFSTNRKYIIYYNEQDQLTGFYGDLSNQIVKGFCSICNQESNVSLFLKKSKTNSDGRYVKKGDYICHDSFCCNQQLVDINQFNAFMKRISEK